MPRDVINEAQIATESREAEGQRKLARLAEVLRDLPTHFPKHLWRYGTVLYHWDRNEPLSLIPGVKPDMHTCGCAWGVAMLIWPDQERTGRKAFSKGGNYFYILHAADFFAIPTEIAMGLFFGTIWGKMKHDQITPLMVARAIDQYLEECEHAA